VRSKIIGTSIFNHGQWEKKKTCIIGEVGVTLTVNGEPWLTFMCTPSDLPQLAIGFLFNEEIITSKEEVASVRVCPGEDNIDVWLNHAVQKPDQWIRTSGCSGGKTSISKVHPSKQANLISPNGSQVPAEQIGQLIEALSGAQTLYKKSGGVHTSALSDGKEIYQAAEDIGRHNTLDKLAGYCLLNGIFPKSSILLTTGRISSEMMQKAARMGVSLVISRTSPSSLSVQMADQWGITLIGYARRDRFTVYTHAERILSVAKVKAKTNSEA
jgi:FdhD protein